jgi:hypothetical protein
MTRLLERASEPTEAFSAAYDDLADYLRSLDMAGLDAIREELSHRRVPCLSYYDVAIDFLLLDAFDDVDSPPGPVAKFVESTWVPAYAKRAVGQLNRSTESASLSTSSCAGLRGSCDVMCL